MKRHFNTHIEGLDLEFWHDLIMNYGSLATYRKGEYICRKGECTNICGFVKSGYFIYTMVGMSGQTSIGGFAFPDALCGDYPNCIYNKPAAFDLVAGCRSEAWIFDATILCRLFSENMEYSEHGRLLMESTYNSLLQRYYNLCANTPTERYKELIKEHPQIEQDIPQAQIAKYLHISPIHLCRIRKSLLGKK